MAISSNFTPMSFDRVNDEYAKLAPLHGLWNDDTDNMMLNLLDRNLEVFRMQVEVYNMELATCQNLERYSNTSEMKNRLVAQRNTLSALEDSLIERIRTFNS